MTFAARTPPAEALITDRGTFRAGPFTLGWAAAGDGPPALVIGSATYYPRVFSADLARARRLVFVDHRGHGVPDGPVGPADLGLEAVLADVEHARETLGLGKVVVVGHSGQGFMALEYAKRHRAHVSHVVLIGMGPSQSDAHRQLAEDRWAEAVCPARKALLDAAWADVPAALERAPERRFATFCLAMGPRSWYDPAFDAAPLWEGVPLHMPAIDHLWGEAFRDLDITQGLDALDVPVFLALGRFDYLVAPAEAWAPYRPRFRDLTVRTFDQSGHTPPFEEPARFDAELLGWLASRPAG